MPIKIEFSAIYATSEDAKYRLQELNCHGPTVRGWQSARNCTYPQEIVLQLEKRCSLCKIQLLAHQYLISSRIELFSSNDDTNTIEDVASIAWDYLGYVHLSDNQNTGFKSRELKSANVPITTASFIKLILGENHQNSHNNSNQVSLIAVNVLGTQLAARRMSATLENGAEDAFAQDPERFSIYDDLAFEMYVDTDVAKIVREMETKKRQAVIIERFEYARKLKVAMEGLRTAGEKLGKYELEKRHAIEKEDYERARTKKNQSDEFRNATYEEMAVEQLLEIKGHCLKNDQCDEIDCPNPLSPTLLRVGSDKRANSPQVASPLHLSRHQSPKKGSPSSTGSPTSFQTRGSFRRRNKSAGAIVKSTFEQYEEKPLPALRHSHTNEFLRECQLDIDIKTTSKLTEREKKQAALPILVFGSDLVEKFYSKHYCDKEDGLNRLKTELLGYDNTKMHTANKTARGAIFLLHRTLRDKVFSVYSLANEVIRLFFVQFVPGRVSPPEVSRSVDKLLPELLTKSGDTSARIHHMAVHTILTMADCKNVRDLHLIPIHLSRPVNSSTHPRLALSRAEMVEQLILSHGISTDKQSGLTCRTLTEFGTSGLHHPAEAVRKVAERILVLVYRINSRLVRKQLPPDDDITRRNLLYRQLFQEFDKIDLARKKEMLEKARNVQDFLSPEPTPNELSKCQSTSNIQNIFNYDQTNGVAKHYPITKSLSGGNLNNGTSKADRERLSSSSASGVSSPSNNSQKEEDEKQCIFCNETESNILLVSNSMNSHYWRSCPMLARCVECSQVVEVATLIEHLLMECEQRATFTQCSRCSEAVKNADVKYHAKACKELREGCNRCPLCHENLEDVEHCWKKHLMGARRCVKNMRLKAVSQKQVTIQV